MNEIIENKEYKSPPVGNEISCVMFGIDEKKLKDNQFLKKIVLEGLKNEGFTILGEQSHNFEPHGFSIIVLLSESHASMHTYPEYGSLHFGIYTCRSPEDGRGVFNHIKKELNPLYAEIIQRNIIVDSEHLRNLEHLKPKDL